MSYLVRLNVVGDRVPMVQDYAAMYAGVRQYLGLLWQTDAAGYVPTNEVVQIPENSAFLGEYLRHLRAGDLVPADARIAKLCGVPFTPPVTED